MRDDRCERALDQVDLETVLFGRTGVREKDTSGGAGPFWQLGFGRLDAPRLMGNATDGDATGPIRLDNRAHGKSAKA
ncbi:hypothetical protein AJ87_39465 [Rhizobium yanglingense]|nr:hypothetical protein AJ87_39465 [Rhizobium yanglingense]